MNQTMRRIIVTIPSNLLQQMDEMAARLNLDRSQFICQSVETFLEEQRRHELRVLLKEGYLYRAQESLRIAEEFVYADYEAVTRYVPWDE